MMKFEDIENIFKGSDFHIPPMGAPENKFSCEDFHDFYHTQNKPPREIEIGYDNDYIEQLYTNQYNIWKLRLPRESFRKHMIDSGFVSFDGDTIQTHPVTYDRNEYGYRSDNFSTDEEGIIFLGCSDTHGDGQFENQTWPRIVAQNLNMKCYNLGISGASLDSVYRHFKMFVHKVKSNNVFLLTPSIYRTELYVENDTVNMLPNAGNGMRELKEEYSFLPEHMFKYYLNYLKNFSQILINYNKNIDAIQHLCHQYDMKLFVIPNPNYYDDIHGILTDWPIYDRAVDGGHKGIIFQKRVADAFLKIYKKNQVFNQT